MSETLAFRQQVEDFRRRLTTLAHRARGDRRVMIDTTGNRSRVVPSYSDTHRLQLYGERRYISVVRVLLLFALLRDRERLDLLGRQVRVEAVGAFWQAFRGTNDRPACHTCPALLLMDGQLPTLATTNTGLRRHLTVEFADCMLMPRELNQIDGVVDDALGREAFAEAGAAVLNTPGMDWRGGAEAFTGAMRRIFGGFDVTHLVRGPDYQAGDAEAQRQLDALAAYYEGLFLTPDPRIGMENFRRRVEAEIARG